MSLDPHHPDVRQSRYFTWLASLTPPEREAMDIMADELAQPLYVAFKTIMGERTDLPAGIWVHMARRLFLVLEYRLNTIAHPQPTEETS